MAIERIRGGSRAYLFPYGWGGGEQILPVFKLMKDKHGSCFAGIRQQLSGPLGKRGLVFQKGFP
jgi:hypothetical protein